MLITITVMRCDNKYGVEYLSYVPNNYTYIVREIITLTYTDNFGITILAISVCLRM